MSKKAAREEIEEFVKENLTRVDRKGKVVCIDGRINPEQSEGAIRAPGGDFGIIMAFAGALKDEGTFIDPEEVIERYSRAKKQEFGQDTKFDYHCDSHNHEAGSIGCGHIAKAVNPENDGLYGSLNHIDVRKLFDAFTKYPDSHLTVLDGHHEEKAVLLVYGNPQDEEAAYSVHSRDRKGNMYFVADIDRAINLIKKLTPQFSVGLQISVSADDVIINYLKQFDTTVGLIASDKDKHKITVDSNRNFSMEQLPKPKPQPANQ
jgi:hypothetical protein